MFIYKRCKCTKNSITPSFNEDIISLSKILSLISVESRLKILLILQEKPHCVCDLITHTNLSQSLISHHLADLTKANLIISKRTGKYVDYLLTNKGKKIIKILKIIN